MRLIDTSIFVYARGGAHHYQAPCREFVARLSADPEGYTIDTELLQEILHVYSSRRDLVTAFSVFDGLIQLFPRPEIVTADILVTARHVMQAYGALSSRDAIHAAVVKEIELDGIVTTDRAFNSVAGLRVFDPRDLIAGR